MIRDDIDVIGARMNTSTPTACMRMCSREVSLVNERTLSTRNSLVHANHLHKCPVLSKHPGTLLPHTHPLSDQLRPGPPPTTPAFFAAPPPRPGRPGPSSSTARCHLSISLDTPWYGFSGDGERTFGFVGGGSSCADVPRSTRGDGGGAINAISIGGGGCCRTDAWDGGCSRCGWDWGWTGGSGRGERRDGAGAPLTTAPVEEPLLYAE